MAATGFASGGAQETSAADVGFNPTGFPIIDQKAYVQDRSQLQAKGQANPIVLGAYTSWFAGNVGGTNGVHYDVMGPLSGPEGYSYSNWHPRAMMSGGPGVITESCTNPEVAIRRLDNLYDVDTNFQLGYGAEGEGTEKGSDGVWRILDPRRVSPPSFCG